MTWNSDQIRACLKRLRDGDDINLTESSGAPHEVVMAYGGLTMPKMAMPLEAALCAWLLRVEQAERPLSAGEPAQPKVTTHKVTRLYRRDGTLSAEYSSDKPDELKIMSDDDTLVVSGSLDSLADIVAVARRARDEATADATAIFGGLAGEGMSWPSEQPAPNSTDPMLVRRMLRSAHAHLMEATGKQLTRTGDEVMMATFAAIAEELEDRDHKIAALSTRLDRLEARKEGLL